ncbi:hypothetical protein [Streptomyces rimosus]
MSFTGPALVAADTAHPGIEYEAEWGALFLVGQALPWWPYLLRLTQLINKWEPGAPRAVAEVPPNANEKTLRRAQRCLRCRLADRPAGHGQRHPQQAHHERRARQ